jgi:hypothetical protein
MTSKTTDTRSTLNNMDDGDFNKCLENIKSLNKTQFLARIEMGEKLNEIKKYKDSEERLERVYKEANINPNRVRGLMKVNAYFTTVLDKQTRLKDLGFSVTYLLACNARDLKKGKIVNSIINDDKLYLYKKVTNLISASIINVTPKFSVDGVMRMISNQLERLASKGDQLKVISKLCEAYGLEVIVKDSKAG